MDFDKLPTEIILKIFSYLPQSRLVTISNVSERWRKLAFDPYLWTNVCIDSRLQSAQDVRDLLDRTTMLRKLDISEGAVHFTVVASTSKHFTQLTALVIQGRDLSHPAMSHILRNCPSLTSITLSGEGSISPTEIRALETLTSLKMLIAYSVYIPDDGLKQICASCPTLERLLFNADRIAHKDTWECFQGLRYLNHLCVNYISTAALLHASKSCPNMARLTVVRIVNENGITAAHALQGFVNLKELDVRDSCGSGWFNANFRTPRCLENLHMPCLAMNRNQLKEIVKACSDTLQHIAMNGRDIGRDTLSMLSECKHLKSIEVFSLIGFNLVMSTFCKFPKLSRTQLTVSGGMKHVIRQLESMVDILDMSRHGSTELVLTVHCSSQASQNAMVHELSLFKDFLALNTCLPRQHIQDLEQQCWRIKDEKLFWLPTGSEVERTIKTSFPTRSKTLKYLAITIREQ